MTSGKTGDVGAGELAAILGITDRRVRQLVDEGIFFRTGRGRYPLAESVQAYVEWRLKSERDRHAGKTPQDRVAELRAREIEQRIALKDRELITTAEHDAVFDEAFGLLKAALIGLPAALTRDLTQRRAIEDAIDGALNRTAARFEQESAKLRPSRQADPSADEDDA